MVGSTKQTTKLEMKNEEGREAEGFVIRYPRTKLLFYSSAASPSSPIPALWDSPGGGDQIHCAASPAPRRWVGRWGRVVHHAGPSSSNLRNLTSKPPSRRWYAALIRFENKQPRRGKRLRREGQDEGAGQTGPMGCNRRGADVRIRKGDVADHPPELAARAPLSLPITQI